MTDSDDSWEEFESESVEPDLDSADEAATGGESDDSDIVMVSRPQSPGSLSSHDSDSDNLVPHGLPDSPSPSLSPAPWSDTSEDEGDGEDRSQVGPARPGIVASAPPMEEVQVPDDMLSHIESLVGRMFASRPSAHDDGATMATCVQLVSGGTASKLMANRDARPTRAVIDHVEHPQLIRRIFDYMDLDSCLALRATSRRWRDFVDRRLRRHLLFYSPPNQADGEHGLALSTTAKRPVWWTGSISCDIPFDERTKRLLANARILDIHVEDPTPLLCSLEGLLPSLQTIRFMEATSISGRHEGINASSAVVFTPMWSQWLAGDAPPEYSLPAKTGVLHITYHPPETTNMLPGRLHATHLEKLTIIFNAVGGFGFNFGDKTEDFLLEPLLRILAESWLETDFILVGLLEIPVHWFGIHEGFNGASDAETIASRIWEGLFYAIRDKYDDELYPQEQVMARIQNALRFMAVEEYMSHVGEEQFALHTESWMVDYL